ncbi:hypothetical protein NLG97_g7137 [Lecanicillium saksenae]|uniref:Uncharacterized protein n=1 Tax=Lecanicillium saksenae TaxID=468837 RepID=A0ACC1QP89_9HYPO|nr:hypothetical protein NLG97_g7137 [Lecanicillium saksenae]
MDTLLNWVQGTGPSPFASIFSEGLAKRSNTPTGAYDQILGPDTSYADQRNRLWAVDRVLEEETVPHFLEFAITGELLSGRKTSLPILGEEIDYIQVPMTQWAPAPYNTQEISLVESLMHSIGSTEDHTRMIPITKELLAMKARIWEGIQPLSERRWTELGLDSPDHFHEACAFISAATDVFNYLNIPEIKAMLRATYNLIWGHLNKFDKALHGLQLDSTDPDFSMAALWHEYIHDHFGAITNASHSWVIDHLERLREPILDIVSQDTSITAFDVDDDYGETLADLIHDLHQGIAEADSSIFIPMDGYQGGDLPSQDHVPGNTSYRYREDPIEFSASRDKRKPDYYFRVRYLSHRDGFKLENLLQENSVSSNAKGQIVGERQARLELRGEPQAAVVPRWVAQARRHTKHDNPLHWGYIGYRTFYDHGEEEWERFKTNFQADISNWGHELGDVDDIRALSVVEWRDAKDAMGNGLDGIAAAEKEFAALAEDEQFMESYHEHIFLVADEAVIDSYLKANTTTSGHVMAVESGFNPEEEDPGRMEESPGYEGWLRLQGSLLWDDFSALMLMHTQYPMELWPLAKDDPEKIYRHPFGPVKG